MPSVMRYVKLDTTADHPVSIWDDKAGTEPGTDIEIDTSGENEIEWERCDDESGWHFHDIAQDDQGTNLPDPPFHHKDVDHHHITIKDDNEEDPGNSASYTYQIAVKETSSPHTIYWTDPSIVNRGGD